MAKIEIKDKIYKKILDIANYNNIQNIDDFINDIVKKGLQVMLYHDSPWEHIESEKKSINNEKELKEEENKDIQGVESVIETPIVKRIKINRHE